MTVFRNLALVGCLLVVGGCGVGGGSGGSMEPQEAALNDVADLLRAAGGGGRPPGRVADLARFEGTYSLGFEAVKKGDVVVIWGVPMKGEGDSGGEGRPVAYEKAAPSAGGFVLLTNGKVKKMTAAELSAATGKK